MMDGQNAREDLVIGQLVGQRLQVLGWIPTPGDSGELTLELVELLLEVALDEALFEVPSSLAR